MNFEDEPYVRLYTRDTTTWLRLRFEGQAVLALILRKVDRAGVLWGITDPAEDVALILNGPVEFVRVGVDRLLATGTAEHMTPRIVLPRFLEAQSALKSDALRAKEARARRRDAARKLMADVQAIAEPSRPVTLPSQDVTEPSRGDRKRPPASHGVTPSLAYPSPAKPNLSESVAGLVAAVGLKVKFRGDWRPNDAHMARARELGISPARFAELVQHAKLKDYPRGFTSEDDVFARALLFERQDAEQKNFARQQAVKGS